MQTGCIVRLISCGRCWKVTVLELPKLNRIDLCMNPLQLPEQQALDRERAEILQQLEDWLDLPMLVLSFIWLAPSLSDKMLDDDGAELAGSKSIDALRDEIAALRTEIHRLDRDNPR